MAEDDTQEKQDDPYYCSDKTALEFTALFPGGDSLNELRDFICRHSPAWMKATNCEAVHQSVIEHRAPAPTPTPDRHDCRTASGGNSR